MVYEFAVSRGELRLRLTVRPHESVIVVELGAASLPSPAIQLALFVRGGAFRREYQDREWLEFDDCVVAPSWFSYVEMGDPFDRSAYPLGQPVRVAVSPAIVVEWLRT